MNHEAAPPGRQIEAVLVVASEDDGGQARSVALLARHLPAAGVKVHVVVHRESLLTRTLSERGTSFEVLPELIETGLRGPDPDDRGLRAVVKNCRRAPIAVRKLRAICATRRADVLYSHGTWSNYLAAFAGMGRTAPPVVWHIRNDHSGRATRTVGRWLARAIPVRALIAVSASAARPYEGLPLPVAVVHNGLDLADAASASAPGAAAIRTRLGIAEGAVVVGFAGRLAPHKGIGVLMEAFRLAAARLPSLHLVVLGGSSRHAGVDEVAELRRKASVWQLGARIHAPGYVNDPLSWMSAFDLLAVPSTCRDGCPRAAVEALALGVPVVGSDIGGIPELVDHGANGWLVPPGSPDALAEALVALGASRERRLAMAAVAVGRRSLFDARVVASRVAGILSAAHHAHAVG